MNDPRAACLAISGVVILILALIVIIRAGGDQDQ